MAVAGAGVLLAGRPSGRPGGASVVAPAPVLPIRDVKLDVSLPLPCRPVHNTVATGAPAATQQGAAVIDNDTREAWLHRGVSLVPAAGMSPGHRTALDDELVAPGYFLGVFRPPRG